MKKRLTAAILSCLMGSAAAFAGDGQWSVSAGVEATSKYLWRGAELASGSTAIPTLTLDWEKSDWAFELGHCTVAEIKGEKYLEMDLWASCSYKGLGLTFSEYGMGNNLGIGGYEDNAEITLSYECPWFVPVAFSFNTFLFGDDFNDDGSRAFSSYAEVAVPYELGDMTLTAIAGAVPYRSDCTYGNCNDVFKFTNLSIKAAYTISGEHYELPFYAQFVRNPMTKCNYCFVGCVLNLSF